MNDFILVGKLEHQSDRQSLLAQIDRAVLRITQDEAELQEMIARFQRWKKRAVIFQQAYKDADFKNLAYEIQLMNYKANGIHKVIEIQNNSLREKLWEVSKERNALKAILSECFESAIGALGAGETIKPDSQSEDLANRVFAYLKD